MKSDAREASLLPLPVQAGMLGLLVGDACGVPYEFRDPGELPSFDLLEMEPPKGFLRTYEHVPTGTWSDDGAQALCLFESLRVCGYYHPHDFAMRLLRWHSHGYMAVGGYVFDIGNQTSASIARLNRGMTTSDSGLCGERNNGNGSLMRSLPLALLHKGKDVALVMDASRQSRLTHGHARSLVCCSLYCLWARRELEGSARPWEDAVETLRGIYAVDPISSKELEEHVKPESVPHGSGSSYVVDSLHSARLACCENSYENVVKKAISLGNDTDTTACLAGGIAAIRWGVESVPKRWSKRLRGKEVLSMLGIAASLWGVS